MFQIMELKINNIACNYKTKINDQIKYNLIVLQKQMFKYDKKTFDQFMQNLIKEYEK